LQGNAGDLVTGALAAAVWGRLLICGRLAIGFLRIINPLQVVHNNLKYIFAARISLKQKPFNQTCSLGRPVLPARLSRPPVIRFNRERIFAGRSPAVISWPGNVELR
jgi:hypothetical protein